MYVKDNENILTIDELTTIIKGEIIHNKLSLNIKRGEKVALIGPSGEGKTILMRQILMLSHPFSGFIKLFDVDINNCSEAEANLVRKRWGVLFQSDALFNSLTVLENVIFPIVKNGYYLSENLIKEIALFKIALVGLSQDAAFKYPDELSGGMKKRAALARALALDPEFIFLDEPTAGLDPYSVASFNKLMLKLHKNLGITIMMITHDMETLWAIADKVAFLGLRKILAYESVTDMVNNQEPLIKKYFSGLQRKTQVMADTNGT